MLAKIVGKKIFDSVDKSTGEVKTNAFIFYTSKFGNVVSGGTVQEGLETGDAYIPADLARQIPIGVSAYLDFDKRGFVKNVEVIEGGNGK